MHLMKDMSTLSASLQELLVSLSAPTDVWQALLPCIVTLCLAGMTVAFLLLTRIRRSSPAKFSPASFYPFSPPKGILNIREGELENSFGWLDLNGDGNYEELMLLKKRLLTSCPAAEDHENDDLYVNRRDVVRQTATEGLSELLDRARREVLEAVLTDLIARFPKMIQLFSESGLDVDDQSKNPEPDVGAAGLNNLERVNRIRVRLGNGMERVFFREQVHTTATLPEWQELLQEGSPLCCQGTIDDLELAARLVPEDLVIMLPTMGTGRAATQGEHTFYLADCLVCFADRWLPASKIGMSMRAIHEPVPHFSKPIATAADGFFRRLKPENGFRIRYNYTFQKGRQWHFLDAGEVAPSEGEILLQTDENPNSQIFMRLERQGMRKLECGAVLFSVRTYLSDVVRMPEGVRADLEAVFEAGGVSGKTSLGAHHIKEWAGVVRAAWKLCVRKEREGK